MRSVARTCTCNEGRTSAEPGIVFGHENMGIIVEVGPGVASVKNGDRVVLPFNVACGFCKNLSRGANAGLRQSCISVGQQECDWAVWVAAVMS